MSSSTKTTIVGGSPGSSSCFRVELKHELLVVLSIPPKMVPRASWFLLREYCLNKRQCSECFSSLLLDDDGLSLVCSPQSLSTLEALLDSSSGGMIVSSQHWKAFVIHTAGCDEPGTVYHLSECLSQEGMSILHISTFESEVFLVQEHDVERACGVLRNNVRNMMGKLKNRTRISGGEGNGGGVGGDLSASVAGQEQREKILSLEGFELCVLPGHFVLTRLNEGVPVTQCSEVLTQLLLFDERFSYLERDVVKNQDQERDGSKKQQAFMRASSSGARLVDSDSAAAGADAASTFSLLLPNPPISSLRDESEVAASSSSSSSSLSSSLPPSSEETKEEEQQTADGSIGSSSSSSSSGSSSSSSSSSSSGGNVSTPPTFLWGLWQCDKELTFLLEEADVDKFPEGALAVSPQRWRVIKLCGRPIRFDEKGIVSAMTTNVDTVILNISTSTTNCTLVPEELLDSTLESLASVLKCPIVGSF